MLEELKFAMGAVSKKDFLPALTHFRIEGGKVRSFNGTLALCTPIALDLECTPKAVPLVKAIQNCEETVSLSLTPTGKLSVKSGSFRALIECVQEETPHVVPEGVMVPVDGESLLKAFKVLAPLIGDDASRPWSNGILLKGESAFATNNIIVAEYWVGSEFPLMCNVPRMAVREMLRIGEAPEYVQSTDTSITFHYEGGRWIRTALYETSWPDLSRVLDVTSDPVPIDPKLFEGIEKLKPFVDPMGKIFFKDSGLATHLEPGEGAAFGIEGFMYEGAYQISMLSLLNGIANSADFTAYPKPCQFFGERLRGAIVGMRI